MDWLSIIKNNLQESTYAGYYANIVKRMIPFFQKKRIYLKEIQPTDIQEYYNYLRNTYHIKNVIVIHHHTNIHKALEFAVKNGWLEYNPADRVERPKAEHFLGSVYTEEERKQLFQAIRGDSIELPVILAACYGLRREEMVGLKWKAIHFSEKTLTIEHTVVCCVVDG